jgi:hypothetical protein
MQQFACRLRSCSYGNLCVLLLLSCSHGKL